MSLILLSGVAAVGMAQPVVHPDAMRAVVRNMQPATMVMELFVDPAGVAMECQIFSADLSEGAKERICQRAIGRQMGQGARGEDGTPVHGEVTIARLTGASPSVRQLDALHPREAQLEIVVSALPDGAERHELGITVFVNESGHIRRCLQNPEHELQYVEIACAQATAHTFPMRHGADGAPVGYVGILNVDFIRE